jgi:transcriptional regulator with XRE-family HTH domain
VLQIAGGSLFGRQHMNSLDVFAQNLRRECRRFPSIADVCRQAEINRQQFNKYLAGKGLPSAAVLHKICSTLNVSEHILFNAPVEPSVAPPLSAIEQSLLLLRNVPGLRFDKLDLTNTDFPEGDFFCYFQMHKVPGMLVRSFLRVKRHGVFTGFVRSTVLSNSGSKMTLMLKGRHSGVVLATQSEYNFIGQNRYAPFQLSFMSVPRLNGTGPIYFSGHASTKSAGETISSRFCLSRILDTHNTRNSLRQLSLVHEHEASVETLLMSSLIARD